MTQRADSPELDATLFQEAIELLQSAKAVAIFSHMNPDPDAYGSSCGLASVLKAYGKAVTVFNPNGVFARQKFIPGVSEVLDEIPDGFVPDLIVVCDCGELYRVGDDFESWIGDSEVTVLNVDHHQSNPLFGEANLVDIQSSSTSEILLDLCTAWSVIDSKVTLPPDACDCFLAGILGDTGGFRYRSTSSDTLHKSAVLVERGARLSYLTQELFGSVPLPTLRLQGIGIEKLRVLANGAIAGSTLTMADYDTALASTDDAENLVELIRDIEGVVISWTLRWMEGKWKASLRTASDKIDLSAVAKEFGGGGHKAAAAFRASGELDEIASSLEAKLVEAYEAYQLSAGQPGESEG